MWSGGCHIVCPDNPIFLSSHQVVCSVAQCIQYGRIYFYALLRNDIKSHTTQTRQKHAMPMEVENVEYFIFNYLLAKTLLPRTKLNPTSAHAKSFEYSFHTTKEREEWLP